MWTFYINFQKIYNIRISKIWTHPNLIQTSTNTKHILLAFTSYPISVISSLYINHHLTLMHWKTEEPFSLQESNPSCNIPSHYLFKTHLSIHLFSCTYHLATFPLKSFYQTTHPATTVDKVEMMRGITRHQYISLSNGRLQLFGNTLPPWWPPLPRVMMHWVDQEGSSCTPLYSTHHASSS